MVPRPCTLVLFAVLTVGSPCPTQAATLHVPSDYPSIEAAVVAAAPADTVLIECGTYYEHSVAVVKEIVVRSQSGTPDCVKIDAGGVGSVFTCRDEGHLTLEGVTATHAAAGAINVLSGRHATLRDCVLRDNTALWGAAIYLSPQDGGESVEAERCSFVGNVATAEGGAIAAWTDLGGGLVEVRASQFVSNSAQSGGAAFVWGPAVFSDCSFESNTAGIGGALRLADQADVSDCSFVGNTSPFGGALCCASFGYGYTQVVSSVFRDNSSNTGGAVVVGSIGLVRMADCRFEMNSAAGLGGAVYINEASGRLEDCWLQDNHADRGGAAVASEGSLAATGTVFFRNSATTGGGAIWCDNRASLGLNETTLCLNGTPGVGGGVWLMGGSTSLLHLDRTIIAFSTSGEAVHRDSPSPSAYIRCTDVVGNAGGDWVGMLHAYEGTNGNLSADPTFCDLIAGTLTLSSSSPCAADYSPPGCGLIGALPVGCGTIAVEPQTWGRTKAVFR